MATLIDTPGTASLSTDTSPAHHALPQPRRRHPDRGRRRRLPDAPAARLGRGVPGGLPRPRGGPGRVGEHGRGDLAGRRDRRRPAGRDGLGAGGGRSATATSRRCAGCARTSSRWPGCSRRPRARCARPSSPRWRELARIPLRRPGRGACSPPTGSPPTTSGSPRLSGLPTEARRALLLRFGLFGVRLSIALLHQGVDSPAALAAELVRHSGLTELQHVLHNQFAERRDLLKARSALLALDTVLQADPRPGSRRAGAARWSGSSPGPTSSPSCGCWRRCARGAVPLPDAGARRGGAAARGDRGGGAHPAGAARRRRPGRGARGRAGRAEPVAGPRREPDDRPGGGRRVPGGRADLRGHARRRADAELRFGGKPRRARSAAGTCPRATPPRSRARPRWKRAPPAPSVVAAPPDLGWARARSPHSRNREALTHGYRPPTPTCATTSRTRSTTSVTETTRPRRRRARFISNGEDGDEPGRGRRRRRHPAGQRWRRRRRRRGRPGRRRRRRRRLPRQRRQRRRRLRRRSTTTATPTAATVATVATPATSATVADGGDGGDAEWPSVTTATRTAERRRRRRWRRWHGRARRRW